MPALFNFGQEEGKFGGGVWSVGGWFACSGPVPLVVLPERRGGGSPLVPSRPSDQKTDASDAMVRNTERLCLLFARVFLEHLQRIYV